MMTLHPTPRGRDVVREQVRIVGLSLRRELLVVAVVLGIVTLRIVFDIVRADASTWFDSGEWFPISVVFFLSPFAVWRREQRFGPAFLWTLPVDRRRLALAKVFAGWVWLMAALAGFVVWQRVLAVVSGVVNARTVPLIAFVGASAAYLFGSALVLGLRHPLRWLLGTAGVFFLLGMLNEASRRGDYVDTLLRCRAVRAVLEAAVSGTATFFWLAAGLAALWVAASRHGERRRH